MKIYLIECSIPDEVLSYTRRHISNEYEGEKNMRSGFYELISIGAKDIKVYEKKDITKWLITGEEEE